MPLYATTNADYFTFNVDNSMLLTGRTGSGKTELVRRYIARLERAFKPGEMQYAIFDLKAVEFSAEGGVGNKPEYNHTHHRTGKPEDVDYLEELAALAKSRAGVGGETKPLIFIYIEECDFAVQYPDRFVPAVMTINEYAKAANMKLIYSTSRLDSVTVPPELRDSFDLILSGYLATLQDEDYIGVPGAARIQPREFIVKENEHSRIV